MEYNPEKLVCPHCMKNTVRVLGEAAKWLCTNPDCPWGESRTTEYYFWRITPEYAHIRRMEDRGSAAHRMARIWIDSELAEHSGNRFIPLPKEDYEKGGLRFFESWATFMEICKYNFDVRLPGRVVQILMEIYASGDGGATQNEILDARYVGWNYHVRNTPVVLKAEPDFDRDTKHSLIAGISRYIREGCGGVLEEGNGGVLKIKAEKYRLISERLGGEKPGFFENRELSRRIKDFERPRRTEKEGLSGGYTMYRR